MGSEEEVKASQGDSMPAVEGIVYRPNASGGVWLCCLLPFAYLAGAVNNRASLSDDYKYSMIIAFGLLLQSIKMYLMLTNFWRKVLAVDLTIQLLPSIVTAALLSVCLHENIAFSAVLSIAALMSYNGVCLYVLKHLPRSFTYGEATIVVQGFVLFLVNVLMKLIFIVDYEPLSNVAQISTILQVGLVGVTFIAVCCHFVKVFRGKLFYVLLAFVGLVVVLFPIGDDLALVVLLQFVFSDTQRICLVLVYLGLLGLTAAATSWHISGNQPSNTRVRKIFHILIVVAFIPGLLYQCTFLFVASGISLALLIVLEIARIIKLQPIDVVLNEAVKAFIDEKDAGHVALTPIYLLVGCSMPLWLHPCPCDLTDAAGFQLLPLLSGVLSVGIGDTAASVIGSKYGRFRYPGSPKSVEGTVAAIVAQALVLPILLYFGFLRTSNYLYIKFGVAIVCNSLVETFTDQVDNLVLPLVTYILLSLFKID